MNPDSFMVNPELNKEPIREVREYLNGNKQVSKNIGVVKSLDENQEMANIVFEAIDKLEKEMSNVSQESNKIISVPIARSDT